MAGSKKPFAYFGGKSGIVPDLLKLIPEHSGYVEVFGGSAALLFAKQPARLNVYNDIDSGLWNFFTVLRDHGEELVRQLELTPHSRQEWRVSRDTWKTEADPIVRARRWYVVAQQGFAANHGRAWGFTSDPSHGTVYDKFFHAVEALPHFSRFLHKVTIENRPFEFIFKHYDHPDNLFYVDPPYKASTRRDGKYDHDMTDEDHSNLLDLACASACKVILSGYDSPLYREKLADWQCVTIDVTCASVARTRKSGYKGEGKIAEKQTRQECIWIKPNTILPEQIQTNMFGMMEVASA